MGALREIVKKADSSSQVEAEVKEALAILVELAQGKAESAEEEIKLDLQTGKTTDNLTVPITKIISEKIEYRAVTAITSDIVKNVSESLQSMFSGNDGILKGIAGIASSALTAIAGAGEGQESETRIYSVVAEYPAIVRFDFYLWGRNTSARSIMTQVKTAFACIACKSAVDMSKLDYNTFLALYSPILKAAFGNDQTKLKEMIKESKEIYDMFNVKNNIPNHTALDVDETVQSIINTDSKLVIPQARLLDKNHYGLV